tara:strand:- start:12354 stop:12746 length:393 start_codon:yes stop_codon:yes gene_type:complete
MIQKIPLLIFAAFLLFSCKSSKKTTQGPIQLKSDIEILSPGHVEVKFKVLNEEATEPDSSPIYKIEILTINKYGTATPVLAKGEVLSVLLRAISLKDKLTIGTIHIGLLAHLEKIVTEKPTPSWDLLNIK